MRFFFLLYYALNCSWQWLIGHGKRRTGPAPAPAPPSSPPLCWHVCFEPRTRKASHKNISAGKKVTKRCRSCVIPRVLSRFGSVQFQLPQFRCMLLICLHFAVAQGAAGVATVSKTLTFCNEHCVGCVVSASGWNWIFNFCFGIFLGLLSGNELGIFKSSLAVKIVDEFLWRGGSKIFEIF